MSPFPETEPPTPAAGERTERAPRLRAEDLTCVRGENELFAGLSFELGRGEVVQVEGANGSGKSTLLRALCGLVPVERGRITWDGLEIGEAGADYLEALTYIGHAPAVKRELTPWENLKAARALGRAPTSMDASRAFERLGLADAAHTPLAQLSAGQRRRAGLARLLVAPTPLWVLDEPLTALDAAGRRLVEDLVSSHCAAGGLVALSTHQPIDLNAAVHRLVLQP